MTVMIIKMFLPMMMKWVTMKSDDGFCDKFQSETGVLRTCTLGCTKIANIPKYKSISDPFLLLVCFVTIISRPLKKG